MSGECYFLFNTLKINTLSDTYNFYLRLLGFTNTKILFDAKSLRGLRKKLKNINEPNIRDIDGYDQIPLIKDSFMMRIFS